MLVFIRGMTFPSYPGWNPFVVLCPEMAVGDWPRGTFVLLTAPAAKWHGACGVKFNQDFFSVSCPPRKYRAIFE